MVIKEAVRRLTLYDLVEDTELAYDKYKKENIPAATIFQGIRNLWRASIRLSGDFIFGLGLYGVLEADMSSGYLLYGAGGLATAYIVDHLLFEKYLPSQVKKDKKPL